MTVSLQVLYPVAKGTTFDFGYYMETHFPLVDKHMGKHIASISASKGIAGGPDVPPGFHAVATMKFSDMDALQAALGAAAPVLADIPNFTNTEPQMLIGEVLG
ncbi:MAG: EthD family reductase [Rhodobacteraceae bacterium]|nr:EthD family reductase [Paracoccaceae bacterium]